MATTQTRNIIVSGNWTVVPFLLISNISQTTVEFWADSVPPVESDVGHPLIPDTGLNKSVFGDNTAVVYFRSTKMSAMLTVTEYL
jgi:hypothetical protein